METISGRVSIARWISLAQLFGSIFFLNTNYFNSLRYKKELMFEQSTPFLQRKLVIRRHTRNGVSSRLEMFEQK